MNVQDDRWRMYLHTSLLGLYYTLAIIGLEVASLVAGYVTSKYKNGKSAVDEGLAIQSAAKKAIKKKEVKVEWNDAKDTLADRLMSDTNVKRGIALVWTLTSSAVSQAFKTAEERAYGRTHFY